MARKEYDDGQFWRDENGIWHDWLDRTFERKRDAYEKHAEDCGCEVCVAKAEHYLFRVYEDEIFKREVVAWMNVIYWLLRGYDGDDLEIFRDGTVVPKHSIDVDDNEMTDDSFLHLL
jgi:hypothetical protein